MKIEIGLKLKGSQADIKRAIVSALRSEILPKLNSARSALDVKLQLLFRQTIRASKEYKSLKGEGPNSLMGHFGLSPGGAKVDDIIDRWTESIHSEIRVLPSSTQLNISLIVYTVNKTFADVLSLPAAVQETESKGKAGLLSGGSTNTHLVTWLKNLLLDGDRTIIYNYRAFFNPENLSSSRSGQAIMVKGRRWGVPSEFAGTLDDNWVTKTLEEVDHQIPVLLEETLRTILT